MKEIEPIAYFRSPFTTKFGIPRQSGLVSELRGHIVFEPKFSNADALRGLEGFDYIWLIWVSRRTSLLVARSGTRTTTLWCVHHVWEATKG